MKIVSENIKKLSFRRFNVLKAYYGSQQLYELDYDADWFSKETTPGLYTPTGALRMSWAELQAEYPGWITEDTILTSYSNDGQRFISYITSHPSYLIIGNISTIGSNAFCNMDHYLLGLDMGQYVTVCGAGGSPTFSGCYFKEFYVSDNLIHMYDHLTPGNGFESEQIMRNFLTYEDGIYYIPSKVNKYSYVHSFSGLTTVQIKEGAKCLPMSNMMPFYPGGSNFTGTIYLPSTLNNLEITFNNVLSTCTNIINNGCPYFSVRDGWFYKISNNQLICYLDSSITPNEVHIPTWAEELTSYCYKTNAAYSSDIIFDSPSSLKIIPNSSVSCHQGNLIIPASVTFLDTNFLGTDDTSIIDNLSFEDGFNGIANGKLVLYYKNGYFGKHLINCINIPASLTTLSSLVAKATSISVDTNNPTLAADNGYLVNKLTGRLIYLLPNTTEIPYGVSILGTDCCYNLNSRRIIVPDSVTEVEMDSINPRVISPTYIDYVYMPSSIIKATSPYTWGGRLGTDAINSNTRIDFQASTFPSGWINYYWANGATVTRNVPEPRS